MSKKLLTIAVGLAIGASSHAAPLVLSDGTSPTGAPEFKELYLDADATYDAITAKDDKTLIGRPSGVNLQIGADRNSGAPIHVVVNGPTNFSNFSDLGDQDGNPPSLLLVTDGSTLQLNGDVTLKSESINGQNMHAGGINTLYAESGSTVDVGTDSSKTVLVSSGVKPDVIQVVRDSTVNIHSLDNLIVGNVDFLSFLDPTNNPARTFGKGSTLNMTLSGPKSVWFGDEVNGNNVWARVNNIQGQGLFGSFAALGIKLLVGSDFTTTFGSEALNKLVEDNKALAEKYLPNVPSPKDMHGDLNFTLKNGAQWIYLGVTDGATRTISKKGVSADIEVRTMPERISNITLDGGIVNLHDADVERMLTQYKIRENFPHNTISSAHDVVVLGNVRGNGIFRVDLVEDKPTSGPDTDMIFIENADAGTTATIEPYGIENLPGISESKHLRFATVAPGAKDNVKFADKVNVNGKGLIDYELFIGSQDHKPDERYDSRYTRVNPSTGKYAFNWDGGKDWFIYRINQTKSSDRISFENVGLSVYDAVTEMERHDRRMLEQDFYNEQKKGGWAQVRYHRSGVKDAYDGYLRHLRIGGDRLVKEHHRIGLGLRFAEANMDYVIPTGKHGFKDGYMRNWEVMAYDTYRKGLFYYDLVGRFGWLKNCLSGDSTRPMAMGDWRQRYLGLSLEVGKKRLNKDNHEYFLEPEAQLAWTYLFGGRAHIGNLTANPGGHSLIGRLGFRLGREWFNKKKNKNDLYAKVDLLHTFWAPKDVLVQAGGESGHVAWTKKRTWLRVGVGGSYHASRDWDIHGDVSTNVFSNWRHNYLLNLTIRRQF